MAVADKDLLGGLLSEVESTSDAVNALLADLGGNQLKGGRGIE